MAKKFRDADKELKKAGFKPARQSGSHITYKDANGRSVVVPKHGEIKTGTWSGIEKQAGLKQPKQQPSSSQDTQAAQRAAGSGVAPPGKKGRGSGQQGQGQGQQQQKPAKRRLFGGRDGR
ncbi:type II toxin-antitoxin system HicA family toxin [Kribbella sp.]|uniref:type II toxin-antitoxin system HicA family toxin n=1 Tax=Kribbella sp. TaxID=1871183 RepID=UPI002D69C95D|nr:type II toxin-antitoxin system HicA family toxin [Kribbella sp.]HZX06569.1 type II toxin-antitoxin system HicA family toxin [Kribbella sp.]